MPQSFAEQFRSIPMSPNLAQSLGRAHGFAREQAHRAVLLEHLLLALTEDPEAAIVLKASNIDVVRLGTDVSGYLGRLLEDMRAEEGAEPRPDPELLRVMQAAGQAAQQSRRRQIDGAIVLAAVVGDGKSPAAALLKSHGLTFEEAIRALQKASAQLRSQKFATTPAAAAQTETGHVESAPAGGESASPAHSTPKPQGQSQSVDDILAAARARIQQRSTTPVSKGDGKPPAAESPSSAESESLALSSLSTAATPATAAPAAGQADDEEKLDDEQEEPSAPAAPATPPGPPAQEGRTLPPGAAPPAARPPKGPPQFAQRALQGAEGTSRTPLPQRPSDRSARAPWPDRTEPTRPPRPLAPNGTGTGARSAAQPRPRQRSGSGPLVESIPRRMRVGVATSAQVRIARDKIDGLIHLLLNGRGMPQRPDAFVTRALSVRLRAPDGNFWIEHTSPETVWVDTASGLQQDEQATWRWTVTPQTRGRGRLVLLVTARTVGRDGIAAESAPPDRAIEVTVRGNPLRSLVRWTGLLALVLAGVALGTYGHEIWEAAAAMIKTFVGG